MTELSRGSEQEGATLPQAVPEAELKDVPKEFTSAELERWSMTSDTPVGRLQHLGRVVRLSARPANPFR